MAQKRLAKTFVSAKRAHVERISVYVEKKKGNFFLCVILVKVF
jgi:hypothetical protein